LLTGDTNSVRVAGQAVHGWAQSETGIDDPLLFLIDWLR
jgi:hypothetical protein